MKALLFTMGLLTSCGLYAAQVVSLNDGRQVQLNDDFTWNYIVDTPPAEKQERMAPATPVITMPPSTPVIIGSHKPTTQLSSSGIDIVIGAANFESGELRFPTSITNQSAQSVVLVEVEVTLSDPDNTLISQKSFPVWQSIKRLPDTYLRKKTSQAGRDIVFNVPQHASYLMDIKVTNVESR